MKNIPKLRFPDFTDEWQVKRLGDIADKVGDRNMTGSASVVLTNSAVHGVIPQTDFFDKEIAVQGNLTNYYKTKKDDFVYNPRISTSAPVGPFKRNNFGNGVLSPLYSLYRFKDGEILKYFEQYLTATYWHKYMKDVANYGARSDRMAISNNDMLALPFPYPSKKEQKKVANFLTVADEKIAAIDKKVGLLKQYKKGVMQKIFTQQIRFKDESGNEYPDWESKELGEVFDRITHKNKENNQNVLTISAQQGLVSQTDYFSKLVAAKNVTNYYLLQRDDFAYNKSYSAGYPMGAIKRLKYYEKGIVSTLYICFRAKDGLDVGFFEHVFDFGLQNSEIEKVAQEGARNHGLLNIGVEEFFSIELLVPTSKQEQQKIADFLSAIDNKIKAEEAKLAGAKKFKKALLQRMFV